ncbi:MAG: hypothetical protein OEW60_04260, partial [Thiovulaceae bacterium]|nr:hypothetical protein [Sulfurimonadaceae bacterium]
MSDAVKEFEASKQNFLKSISQAFLAPLDESLATLEKMQSSDQPCNQVGDCDHLKQQLDKLRRGMQNMVY